MERRLPPFPGMDPYLEAPDIFPDLHHRLAAGLTESLNFALPAPYYARTELRAEVGIVFDGGGARRAIPDLALLWKPPPATVRELPAGYGVLTEPRTSVTPGVELRLQDELYQHAFVEVRDPTHGHRLVTLIEIVSPSNKQPGPDRQAYQRKQREVMGSDASLIEIDLLRTGRRLLPHPELEGVVHNLDPDYLVLLNRGSGRTGYGIDYTLYPVKLREPLPCIPVPLAGEDPDVPLDLQAAFNRVYLGGPYLRAVYYDQEPDPPLRAEDAAWADQLLRAAGLRSAREEVMERA